MPDSPDVFVPPERLRELVHAFQGKKIGVVGDAMLDFFTRGRIERISPEAPVPVVISENEQCVSGGAGNAAAGVTALGAHADFFAVRGNDERGQSLLATLTAAGIEPHLLVDETRPTTVKHRIIDAGGRHLLRVDWEKTHELSEALAQSEVEHILALMPTWDALIFGDYAKGYVTERMAKEVMDAARTQGLPVVIDTKPSHTHYFGQASLFTPNAKEAHAMAETEDIHEAGRSLHARLASPVLITRGHEGMTLFDTNGTHHLETRAESVIDVSGAGDTVVAVSALALAAGASITEAMQLANRAAAIVIAKEGTATVTAEELLAHI